jgi:hypothetical protein
MKVSELILKLQSLPQDLPVCINNEGAGEYHDEIDTVFQIDDDPENGDEAAVVIAINTL